MAVCIGGLFIIEWKVIVTMVSVTKSGNDKRKTCFFEFSHSFSIFIFSFLLFFSFVFLTLTLTLILILILILFSSSSPLRRCTYFFRRFSFNDATYNKICLK